MGKKSNLIEHIFVFDGQDCFFIPNLRSAYKKAGNLRIAYLPFAYSERP